MHWIKVLEELFILSLGWVILCYGMWVYENATPMSLSDKDSQRLFSHGSHGIEKTLRSLSYVVMVVGSICYLLPFLVRP